MKLRFKKFILLIEKSKNFKYFGELFANWPFT